MEWLGDYLKFCVGNGPGGLVLLGVTGFAALIVAMGVLAGVAKAARAFGKGWRSAG